MINVDDRLLNELDESEMYLVLHIAKHMKSTRMTAWPSLDTLSRACKWDERTVKKHRQSLIDKGYLHMKIQPGKPTLYRFLKKGIGVYSGLDSDEMVAENEGTNIEGGTKNEGTKNANEGVQKMRGVRVQKMYPEVIKGVNKKEVIKEDAAGPLSPPFTKTDLVIGIHDSETPGCVIVDFVTLEAEKKENDLHRGAAHGGEPFDIREWLKDVPLEPPFAPTGEHIAPQPAKVVRLYDNQIPGVEVTVIDSVPGIYTPNPAPPPTEFKRVNIGEEIERIRNDYLLKENFTRTRRIPENLFADYVNAFELEAGSTGETYASVPALRKHFLNWSGSRYEISQKKTTKHTGNGRSHINQAGGDMSKYLEKQKF